MPFEENSILDNIIYLDIETTGLDEKNSEIIEVGAVKIKNGEIFKFEKLIRPKGEVSTSIYELCEGLDKEKLYKAPYLHEIIEELLDFLEDFDIVCHNANSEGGFLKYHIPRVKNKILDSMELSAILEPWRRELNLEALIREITNIDKKEAHRALEDSIDTMKVVNALLCRLWNREDNYRLKNKKYKGLYEILIRDFNLHNRWGWTKYIEKPPFFIYDNFNYVVYDEEGKHLKPVLKPIKIQYDKFEDLLKEEEIWTNGEDFNYEYREEQRNFSRKIRENFEKRERIFIEAPTGSGKTFAYVLIAALESYINKSKRNLEDSYFIISTDTKELQNQLINRDIPSILEKLHLDDKLRFGAIKGKANYLCYYRLREFHNYDLNLKGTLAEIFLKRLCATGEYGDIEDISYWALNHFSLNKYFPHVTCDSEDCNLERCNKPCYLRKRYNELPGENITVINHSLLASWPYGEKKKINHLIIDEAHNLMEKCYDFFSIEVKSDELLEFIGQVDRVEPTIYRQLRGLNLKNNLREDVDLSKIKYWIGEIELNISLILREFIALKLCKEYNFKFEYYLPKEKLKINLEKVNPLIIKLLQGVKGLYALLDKYFRTITEDTDDKEDKEYKNVYRFLINLKEICETIETFCENPIKKEYAKILEVSQDYGYFKLTNTPLYIDKYVNENMLKEVQSTTFLSATMRINNSFKRIKAHLGQKEAKELIVPATFNLKKRTKIFIPTDIGSYSSRNFINNSAQFILKVSEKLKGHTLVLFNNNNRRNLVEERLRELTVGSRIEIYTHKKAINYLKDENRQIIILGSKGFFEGIDIPGDALSCVMLDKFPNKSVDDPLMQAIINYKGSYYKQENYPQLCIKVKQVYGRLIRSVMDYGYFIILDGGNNENTIYDIERDLNGPNIIKSNTINILKSLDEDYKRWKMENLRVILNSVLRKEDFNKEAKKYKSFWKLENINNEEEIYKNIDLIYKK